MKKLLAIFLSLSIFGNSIVSARADDSFAEENFLTKTLEQSILDARHQFGLDSLQSDETPSLRPEEIRKQLGIYLNPVSHTDKDPLHELTRLVFAPISASADYNDLYFDALDFVNAEGKLALEGAAKVSQKEYFRVQKRLTSLLQSLDFAHKVYFGPVLNLAFQVASQRIVDKTVLYPMAAVLSVIAGCLLLRKAGTSLGLLGGETAEVAAASELRVIREGSKYARMSALSAMTGIVGTTAVISSSLYAAGFALNYKTAQSMQQWYENSREKDKFLIGFVPPIPSERVDFVELPVLSKKETRDLDAVLVAMGDYKLRLSDVGKLGISTGTAYFAFRVLTNIRLIPAAIAALEGLVAVGPAGWALIISFGIAWVVDSYLEKAYDYVKTEITRFNLSGDYSAAIEAYHRKSEDVRMAHNSDTIPDYFEVKQEANAFLGAALDYSDFLMKPADEAEQKFNSAQIALSNDYVEHYFDKEARQIAEKYRDLGSPEYTSAMILWNKKQIRWYGYKDSALLMRLNRKYAAYATDIIFQDIIDKYTNGSPEYRKEMDVAKESSDKKKAIHAVYSKYRKKSPEYMAELEDRIESFRSGNNRTFLYKIISKAFEKDSVLDLEADKAVALWTREMLENKNFMALMEEHRREYVRTVRDLAEEFVHSGENPRWILGLVHDLFSVHDLPGLTALGDQAELQYQLFLARLSKPYDDYAQYYKETFGRAAPDISSL